MPSFKTAGKSKEDLAVVAQLAGLLGPEETAQMTRAELVKIINAANKKSQEQAAKSNDESAAAGDDTSSSTAVKTAAGRKKTAVRKKSNAAGSAKKTRKKSSEKPDLQKEETKELTQLGIETGTQEKTDAGPNQAATDKEKPKAGAKVEKPETDNIATKKTAGKRGAPRKSATRKKKQESSGTAANGNEKKATARKASRTRKTVDETLQKNQKNIVEKPESRPDVKAEKSGEAAETSPEAAGAALDKKETDTVREPAKTNNIAAKSETAPSESKEKSQEEADTKKAVDSESAKPKRPYVETGEIQAGVLEIMPDGYGFLRKDNYLQGSKDIYVPPQYIRRFGLRAGDLVSGPVKLQRETDRYQALLYIKEVNGLPPEKMLRRPHFDRLTPIYPDTRYILESSRNELSTRIIDLVAPIGKGQRGMIVSPPKAGKTILLQKIANAISINNPESKLIVLLIDERPEEVTDMQRSINGEVVYSTFDKTPENHTKVVELVLERAMRLVELKQDVVILLDSMTRLARAYNLTINPTGRTLSGGLDPGALYGPKRFFGAARNIENGGSLTIIATSLIETGSRMDEVIFEEFKGTGNMEVYLDRKLSEKRIFPAIDINKSGTRREELLLSGKELDAVWTIRKAFSQLDTSAVTEAIINLLLKTQNNEHFIASVNVSLNDKNVFEAMRGNRQGSGGGSNPPAKNGSYNSSGYSSNYRRYGNSDND